MKVFFTTLPCGTSPIDGFFSFKEHRQRRQTVAAKSENPDDVTFKRTPTESACTYYLYSSYNNPHCDWLINRAQKPYYII